MGEGGAGSGQAASEIPLWYPTVITGKAGDTNVGNVRTQLSAGAKDTEHGGQGVCRPRPGSVVKVQTSEEEQEETTGRRAGQ